jgi:Protein of unknown function (DUF3892)
LAIYVTAIRLAGGAGHEHIAWVRWQDVDNPTETGERSRAEMVDWIEEGGEAYVRGGGRTVRVGVVHDDPPYIRTRADEMWTDNLLALPQF